MCKLTGRSKKKTENKLTGLKISRYTEQYHSQTSLTYEERQLERHLSGSVFLHQRPQVPLEGVSPECGQTDRYAVIEPRGSVRKPTSARLRTDVR